jgi:hypothetical protein
MGDRANIYVIDKYASDDVGKTVGVYLYTHWGGGSLPAILAEGLKLAQSRWGDTAYLTRMLFDHLTGLRGGETGFGISVSLGDNSYPILVVDDTLGQVRVAKEGTEDGSAPPLWSGSYDEFIALASDGSPVPGWR